MSESGGGSKMSV